VVFGWLSIGRTHRDASSSRRVEARCHVEWGFMRNVIVSRGGMCIVKLLEVDTRSLSMFGVGCIPMKFVGAVSGS
jgi:hypothetical protein